MRQDIPLTGFVHIIAPENCLRFFFGGFWILAMLLLAGRVVTLVHFPDQDFLEHAVNIITITCIFIIICAVVVYFQEVSKCKVCSEWQG